MYQNCVTVIGLLLHLQLAEQQVQMMNFLHLYVLHSLAVRTNTSSEIRNCLCVYDCTVNDERMEGG